MSLCIHWYNNLWWNNLPFRANRQNYLNLLNFRAFFTRWLWSERSYIVSKWLDLVWPYDGCNQWATIRRVGQWQCYRKRRAKRRRGWPMAFVNWGWNRTSGTNVHWNVKVAVRVMFITTRDSDASISNEKRTRSFLSIYSRRNQREISFIFKLQS